MDFYLYIFILVRVILVVLNPLVFRIHTISGFLLQFWANYVCKDQSYHKYFYWILLLKAGTRNFSILKFQSLYYTKWFRIQTSIRKLFKNAALKVFQEFLHLPSVIFRKCTNKRDQARKSNLCGLSNLESLKCRIRKGIIFPRDCLQKNIIEDVTRLTQIIRNQKIFPEENINTPDQNVQNPEIIL